MSKPTANGQLKPQSMATNSPGRSACTSRFCGLASPWACVCGSASTMENNVRDQVVRVTQVARSPSWDWPRRGHRAPRPSPGGSTSRRRGARRRPRSGLARPCTAGARSRVSGVARSPKTAAVPTGRPPRARREGRLPERSGLAPGLPGERDVLHPERGVVVVDLVDGVEGREPKAVGEDLPERRLLGVDLETPREVGEKRLALLFRDEVDHRPDPRALQHLDERGPGPRLSIDAGLTEARSSAQVLIVPIS